jgi:hypothetical protein
VSRFGRSYWVLQSKFPARFPRKATPDEIVETLLEFIKVAITGDPGDVRKIIGADDYRLNLVRLTGNLIPDGVDIGEIGLRHGTRGDEPVSLKNQHKFAGKVGALLILTCERIIAML